MSVYIEINGNFISSIKVPSKFSEIVDFCAKQIPNFNTSLYSFYYQSTT